MIALALPSIVAALLGNAAQESGLESWWLTMRVQPRHESAAGISAASLNSRWRRVSLLTSADLPGEREAAHATMKKQGFAFEADQDLDGDGMAERAVVGVYADVTGKTGRFVLILKRSKRAGSWRKLAVFAQPGEPGFSAVAVGSYALEWSNCLYCDSSCLVRREDGRLKLECHDCCDV